MPAALTLTELAETLTGLTYIPGSAAEPTPLLELWASDPDRTRGAQILTSLVPGINSLSLDHLHPTATVTGLFMQPAWQAAQAAGRFRHVPLSYSGFTRHVRERVRPDTCVVHVSPPDRAGRCSFGPAVEFTPLVRAQSRRTVALINPALPPMPGAASVDYASLDAVVETGFAPRGYVVGVPNQVALAIAGHVAGLIGDGCTLQAGLGRVPDALLALLHDRRGLRLHSGMLADSALDLCDAGALDPASVPTSCVWVGSPALYERLRGRDGLVVAGCDVTHDPARLAALPRFHAVNSALSVDLFGQANLEIADGHAVSGIGGAGDFARGARASEGGLSIVALPSTSRGRSRIVARLDDGIASLSRTDIDVVVTEHGVADLRGLSVHGRAEALIAVAGPAFHADLIDAWALVRCRL